MIELTTTGDSALIRVHGNLDATTAPDLRDALCWAVDRHPGVVVDLAGSPRVDPAGLGVLIRAHGRAKHRGGVLCLVAPSRFVLTVLHTMHVDGVFPIFDECMTALRWVRAETSASAAGASVLNSR
ncbi:STAS domain-containing protein [Actinoplanes sp. NPDC051343]|jgi:anti-sigma B factor antagonist|uniref:STAS domain-containing protein n=1 Tax=Actinoplanes sp. NPDC051343 TaxID=3363906 RepID=UPI0037965CB1